ncbi:unnamed protein product [Larinioides sclopetarius]|uniref:Uncharacterized protein n=1 Tax=Larinioides sclopetarius TaxID=280406 RepID=A0AAV2AU04_9ARAC
MAFCMSSFASTMHPNSYATGKFFPGQKQRSVRIQHSWSFAGSSISLAFADLSLTSAWKNRYVLSHSIPNIQQKQPITITASKARNALDIKVMLDFLNMRKNFLINLRLVIIYEFSMPQTLQLST